MNVSLLNLQSGKLDFERIERIKERQKEREGKCDEINKSEYYCECFEMRVESDECKRWSKSHDRFSEQTVASGSSQ